MLMQKKEKKTEDAYSHSMNRTKSNVVYSICLFYSVLLAISEAKEKKKLFFVEKDNGIDATRFHSKVNR